MGLNHDLLLMKKLQSLTDLLDYISLNTNASDTFERYYTSILPPVLESQFPIFAHVHNAETQCLVLSYMAFWDQCPLKEDLIEKAQNMPPLQTMDFRPRTVAPDTRFLELKHPVSALRAAVMMSEYVERDIALARQRGEQVQAARRLSPMPVWRQHAWAKYLGEEVREHCFDGRVEDMTADLERFAREGQLRRLFFVAW